MMNIREKLYIMRRPEIAGEKRERSKATARFTSNHFQFELRFEKAKSQEGCQLETR